MSRTVLALIVGIVVFALGEETTRYVLTERARLAFEDRARQRTAALLEAMSRDGNAALESKSIAEGNYGDRRNDEAQAQGLALVVGAVAGLVGFGLVKAQKKPS